MKVDSNPYLTIQYRKGTWYDGTEFLLIKKVEEQKFEYDVQLVNCNLADNIQDYLKDCILKEAQKANFK